MMQIVNGWHLPDTEKFLCSRIQKSCDPKYERKERTNVWRHLLHSDNPKRTAIDIGSNIGIWSNFLSTFFDNVYAFDPNPTIHECFNKNILERKDNVKFYPVGLGRENSTATLNLSYNNTGSTSIINKTHNSTPVEIKIKQLDFYKLDNIDFIKMDAEGYEIEILNGAIETLLRNKPLIFLEKQEKENNKKLLEFMKEHNAVKLHSWLRNEIWSFDPNDEQFMTIFGNYKIFKREYNKVMKEANSDISE